VTSLFTNIGDDDFPDDLEEGSWEQQCADGMGQEVYFFPAPKSLADKTFAQAAIALYDTYGAILIAAEIPLRTSDGPVNHVILNPAKDWIITEKVTLYAIAPDSDFLSTLLLTGTENPFTVIQHVQSGLLDLPVDVIFAERSSNGNDEEDGRRRRKKREEGEEGEEGDDVIVEDDEEDEEVVFLSNGSEGSESTPSLYDSVVKGVPADWDLVYSIVRSKEPVSKNKKKNREGEREKENRKVLNVSEM
jgi:hypothetical protein